MNMGNIALAGPRHSGSGRTARALAASVLILVAIDASAPLLCAREPAAAAGVAPAPARKPRIKGSDKTVAELMAKVFPPEARSYADFDKIDEALIAQLAAKGSDAMAPLLAEAGKFSCSYRTVCKVFAKMEPSPLPGLLETYRRKPSTPLRYVLYHVLRKRAVESEPTLIKMLKDSDVEIRRLAIAAMGSIAEENVTMTKAIRQPVFDALKDADSRVREIAPAVISRLYASDPAMVGALVDVLKSNPNTPLGYETVLALGKVGVRLPAGSADLTKIVDALAVAVAGDSNVRTRQYAAQYLGKMGPKARAAAPALRKAADDKDKRVRTAAQVALHEIGAMLAAALRKAGADAHLAAVIMQLAGGDRKAARAAEDKLATLGARNLDVLMVAVRNDQSDRYWHAVSRLIASWDRDVAAQLGKYTTDSHHRVRRTVASAWGQMPSITTLPKDLDTLRHDKHPAVRSSVVESLVLLSMSARPKLSKAVLPLMIDAMSDEGIYHVSHGAMYVRLAEMAPAHPEIIAAMIRIVRTSSGQTVRLLAVMFLGRIGARLPADRKEVSEIVGVLSGSMSRGAGVRNTAITALGRMGSRARPALPILRKMSDTSDKHLAKLLKDAIAKITAQPPAAPK